MAVEQSGGILQTADFFLQKEFRTAYDIGGHMQIAVLFAGGVVFGMKFDPRQNTEMQWLDPMTPTIILSGWGEYSHFQIIKQQVEFESQMLADYVGERYVTVPFLSKSICPVLHKQFVHSVPHAVNILLADVLSGNIRCIDFKGHLKLLKRFGILGGYEYIVSGGEVEMVENPKTEFPRKKAILYLEEKFKGRDILDSKAKAVKMVGQTLIRFDPPSKKETFIIIAYENLKFECAVIERKAGSGKVTITKNKK